jgi:hypothetical protein
MLEILNQPLPAISIPNTWQYLFTVAGAGAIFACLWWAFCFVVRNGIDGSKVIARIIRHRKPLLIRKVLLGEWAPLPDYNPTRPNPHPLTLEERWVDL